MLVINPSLRKIETILEIPLVHHDIRVTTNSTIPDYEIAYNPPLWFNSTINIG